MSSVSMSSDCICRYSLNVWNGSVSVSLRCNSGFVLLYVSCQKVKVKVEVDDSDGVCV